MSHKRKIKVWLGPRWSPSFLRTQSQISFSPFLGLSCRFCSETILPPSSWRCWTQLVLTLGHNIMSSNPSSPSLLIFHLPEFSSQGSQPAIGSIYNIEQPNHWGIGLIVQYVNSRTMELSSESSRYPNGLKKKNQGNKIRGIALTSGSVAPTKGSKTTSRQNLSIWQRSRGQEDKCQSQRPTCWLHLWDIWGLKSPCLLALSPRSTKTVRSRGCL